MTLDFEPPIYPEVECRIKDMKIKGESGYFVRLATKIRVAHNRKWYFAVHYKEHYIHSIEDTARFMNNFHREVYISKYKFKVSTKITNVHGQKIFELDTDQDTEKKRVKKHYTY